MRRTENLRAIGLMVAAMAFLTLADTCIKLASDRFNSAEILLFIGLFGTALNATLALRAGHPVLSRAFFHPLVLLRNGSEAVGSVCIVGALVLAPLSLVAAIGQAMPLVITAGAALFLKEPVGARRWIAILIGFGGVLLILRPGIDLSLGALMAVGAVIFFAVRDVTTRVVPPGIPTLQLTTYAFAVLIPVGSVQLAVAGSNGLPDLIGSALLLAIALATALAYFCLTSAMRLGEVAVVAPFRYSRLPIALAVAYAVLGERPDALTLIGAGIVIGTGLYVLLREGQLSRRRVAVTTDSP